MEYYGFTKKSENHSRPGKSFNRGIPRPKDESDTLPNPKKIIISPRVICFGKLSEKYDYQSLPYTTGN